MKEKASDKFFLLIHIILITLIMWKAWKKEISRCFLKQIFLFNNNEMKVKDDGKNYQAKTTTTTTRNM